MKKIKNRQDIIIKYLMSYLLILIIPIIIGSILYEKSLQTLKHYAMQSNMAMLEQSKNIIDRRFMEIDSIINQLSLNPKINKIINSSNSFESNIYSYWDASKDLSNYCATNNFIDSLYILVKNSNAVVSSNFVIDKMSFFYESSLKYDEMDYDKWSKLVFNKYHNREFTEPKKITRNEKQDYYITFLQSLPLGYNNSNDGVLIILIKKNEMEKLLSAPQIENGGWSYVANENGDILCWIGNDKTKINSISQDIIKRNSDSGNYTKSDMVISYTKSKNNGWVYAAGVPSNMVLKSVNSIKKTAIDVTIIILFLGIILSYFLAYKNSTPIRKIIEILNKRTHEKFDNENIYDFLQGSITKVLDNNEEMKSEMETRLPMIKAIFIEKLFKGGFNNIDEIKVGMSNIDLDLKSSCFTVAVLHINGYNGLVSKEILSELNTVKLIITGIIKKIDDCKIEFYDMDYDKVAILFGMDINGRTETKKFLEEKTKFLHDELYNEYKINASFGIGSVCSNLLELYRSFNEAREAVDFKTYIKGCTSIWYDKIKKENDSYYSYSLEIEQKIINIVKASAESELKKILNDIYNENFIQRQLSENMIENLIKAICVTIQRTIQLLNIKDTETIKLIESNIELIEKSNEIDEIWSYINNIFSIMCKYICLLKQKQNNKLIYNIKDYLNAVYMNSELNLYSVASHFELTEGYLSRFLREQMGDNFTHYLEKIRMENACKLLSETDLSINDISARVGYTSDHAFRRAFKKVYAISPSENRKETPL